MKPFSYNEKLKLIHNIKKKNDARGSNKLYCPPNNVHMAQYCNYFPMMCTSLGAPRFDNFE